MLKKIVSKSTDNDGYGFGTVQPGFCIHQAVLTGSYPYLLHYQLTSCAEDTVLAYISRKEFENALRVMN